MKKISDLIHDMKVEAFFRNVSVPGLIVRKAAATPVDLAEKACKLAFDGLGQENTQAPVTNKQVAANWLSFGVNLSSHVRSKIMNEHQPVKRAGLTASGPLLKKK